MVSGDVMFDSQARDLLPRLWTKIVSFWSFFSGACCLGIGWRTRLMDIFIASIHFPSSGYLFVSRTTFRVGFRFFVFSEINSSRFRRVSAKRQWSGEAYRESAKTRREIGRSKKWHDRVFSPLVVVLCIFSNRVQGVIRAARTLRWI